MLRSSLAMLVAACTDVRAPALIAVEPAAAPRGGRVVLSGERLCGEPPNCETAAGEIQIGLDPPIVLATVLEYADDRAMIQIPSVAEIGATDLLVTVNDRTSNALAFEVLP